MTDESTPATPRAGTAPEDTAGPLPFWLRPEGLQARKKMNQMMDDMVTMASPIGLSITITKDGEPTLSASYYPPEPEGSIDISTRDYMGDGTSVDDLAAHPS